MEKVCTLISIRIWKNIRHFSSEKAEIRCCRWPKLSTPDAILSFRKKYNPYLEISVDMFFCTKALKSHGKIAKLFLGGFAPQTPHQTFVKQGVKKSFFKKIRFTTQKYFIIFEKNQRKQTYNRKIFPGRALPPRTPYNISLRPAWWFLRQSKRYNPYLGFSEDGVRGGV